MELSDKERLQGKSIIDGGIEKRNKFMAQQIVLHREKAPGGVICFVGLGHSGIQNELAKADTNDPNLNNYLFLNFNNVTPLTGTTALISDETTIGSLHRKTHFPYGISSIGTRNSGVNLMPELFTLISAKVKSVSLTQSKKLEGSLKTNIPGQLIRRASVFSSSSELMSILVINKESVNVSDDKRKLTALHLSIKNNRFDNMLLLFAFGADHNKKDLNNITPINLINQANNPKLDDVAVKGLLIKYNMTDINKLLRNMANKGDSEAVKLLIRSGVDIDDPGPASKQTALHRATVGNHCKCVEILLNVGAKRNTYENALTDTLNEAIMERDTDKIISNNTK